MRPCSCILATVVLVARFCKSSAVLGSRLAGRSADRFTVDVYVINLDSRHDRCECMQKQLADLPAHVFRQPALQASECDFLTMAPFEKHLGRNSTIMDLELSLFCSNYMIWRAAMLKEADYIVILEDDALLKPGWWNKVQEYLASCGNFDFLLVDPLAMLEQTGGRYSYTRNFWEVDSERVDRCSIGTTYQHRTRGNQNPVLSWVATTMIILRREFLPVVVGEALKQGWGAYDNWWQFALTPHYRAFGWEAGQVTQASVGLLHQVETALNVSGCSSSIVSSNIGLGGPLQLSSDVFHTLNCP